MWIVLFIAVGLVAMREGPESRWFGWLWLLLGVGAFALHAIWFVLVPRWSLELSGGDRDRQSRLLRWIVNTPFPGGSKIRARYLLAANDEAAGRRDEAEAGFRSILRDCRNEMDLPPGFESLLGERLANTLEAMGRPGDPAGGVRRAAKVGQADGTSLGLKCLGQLLDSRHRYGEAAIAYERALALSPPDGTAASVELMMHLVLSTFNAGRPAETLRWAEAVIGSSPDSPMVPLARRMAAVACISLGQLDDAERHTRVGAELAQSPGQRAETLAFLAEYAMRRGELDEAERIAREAVGPGESRTPWIIIALIERERDRLEEAIAALEHARTISVGPKAAMNRRVDAVIDELLALDHAELGHHDVARELIVRAGAELAGDPKLGVTLDAYAALVYALAGERDEALARIDSAERGRHNVPEDDSVQKGVLSLLGWAAMAVDEPGRAEAFLRECLELRPDPLYLPYVWYHLGGCRRRLGDEAGGRACDARAAATHFGCRWERYARERLAAEGVTA